MGSSTVEQFTCDQLDLFPSCSVIDFARAAADIRRGRQRDAKTADAFHAYMAAIDKVLA